MLKRLYFGTFYMKGKDLVGTMLANVGLKENIELYFELPDSVFGFKNCTIDNDNLIIKHREGFTDEEREKFTNLLSSGFIDTFRYFYPDLKDIYSWWSYRFNARKNNAGWRIDYFVVSKSLEDRLESAKIHTDILGSDHCPVELIIK